MNSRADVRTPTEVGRRARLELVFGCRHGRTVLTHGYAEPPLRIGRCLDADRGVRLILASSAPGIFGGDEYRQQVRVEAGAEVRLTSQSALQVHPGTADVPARMSSSFVVEAGGALSCVWDPTIPFAGARLEQRIEIDVAGNGRMSWSDGLMSGRQGHGESWRFASLDHELRLVHRGGLAYLERYRIVPKGARTSRWTVDGAGYVGTTIEAGLRDAKGFAERVHITLASVDGVSASADALDDDLSLVRIVAKQGAAFHRARLAVAGMLEVHESLIGTSRPS